MEYVNSLQSLATYYKNIGNLEGAEKTYLELVGIKRGGFAGDSKFDLPFLYELFEINLKARLRENN